MKKSNNSFTVLLSFWACMVVQSVFSVYSPEKWGFLTCQLTVYNWCQLLAPLLGAGFDSRGRDPSLHRGLGRRWYLMHSQMGRRECSPNRFRIVQVQGLGGCGMVTQLLCFTRWCRGQALCARSLSRSELEPQGGSLQRWLCKVRVLWDRRV